MTKSLSARRWRKPKLLLLSRASERSIARMVKAAYRSMAAQFHPDHGGAAERMIEINGAYTEALRSVRS